MGRFDTFKNHKLQSIDDLHLFTRTGTVHGARTWSESYTSGGSTTSNGPVSVSTTVRERQRYFVRMAGGSETEVNYTGVSVRDGHVVTLVYCGQKNPESNLGWIAAVYNHGTGRKSFDESTIGPLCRVPTTGVLFMRLAAGAVAAIVLTFIGLPWTLAWLLGLGAGGFWSYRDRSRANALAAQVREAINAAIETSKAEAVALSKPDEAPEPEEAAAVPA